MTLPLKPSSAYLCGDDVCHADRDGDCMWAGCPQLRDEEPNRSRRHCPLDTEQDED
jgi:hypothetical protein